MLRSFREGYLDILHRIVSALLVGEMLGSDIENQGKGCGNPSQEQRLRIDQAWNNGGAQI